MVLASAIQLLPVNILEWGGCLEISLRLQTKTQRTYFLPWHTAPFTMVQDYNYLNAPAHFPIG